jgi:hypothetical protein
MYRLVLVMHLIGYLFLAGCVTLWFALLLDLFSKSSKGARKKTTRTALAIVLLLFFAGGVGTMLVDSTISHLHGGGQASLGKAEGGRYFLRRAQTFIEVSEGTWRLKLRLELLVDHFLPVTIVSGLGLAVLATIAKTERTRENCMADDALANK